mmetsp:Transcript_14155/g.39596  ORF Transcript_14155/g.39596 Transcript_14155/m.39596 type:complete len:468 (+) Transcript_14155:160-1563(+)
MDHKGPTPIRIHKVPLPIRHAVVQTQPVGPSVSVFIFIFVAAQDKRHVEKLVGRLVRCLQELLGRFSVRLENQRCLGTDRVDQAMSVGNRSRAAVDGIEGVRVKQIIVHRLVVPVRVETAALGVLHPGVHFLVKNVEVLEHGPAGANGRPRAQHGLVVVNALAIADGPIDQPVRGPDRVVLGKDLQPGDPGSLGSERIPLEHRVSQIGNEDRAAALHLGLVVPTAVQQVVPEKRKAGPPVLEFRIGIEAGDEFLVVLIAGAGLRRVLDGVAALDVSDLVENNVLGSEVFLASGIDIGGHRQNNVALESRLAEGTNVALVIIEMVSRTHGQYRCGLSNLGIVVFNGVVAIVVIVVAGGGSLLFRLFRGRRRRRNFGAGLGRDGFWSGWLLLLLLLLVRRRSHRGSGERPGTWTVPTRVCICVCIRIRVCVCVPTRVCVCSAVDRRRLVDIGCPHPIQQQKGHQQCVHH